jgi:hypothetical protein
MPNLPTWSFDPENVMSTSRYPMPKTASFRGTSQSSPPPSTCFLETVQLLLISCRCGCCVKGLMAAREREEVDRCATPVRWSKELVEEREVGEGSSPVHKMQIAQDSANLTSSTCFVKNCYQAIPKSWRLLASMPLTSNQHRRLAKREFELDVSQVGCRY